MTPWIGSRKVGKSQIKPEIRWHSFKPPDKRRPVLLLTRDEVINKINEVIAVPITSTIRGLKSEVILTAVDGFATSCAINCDHVALVQRSELDSLIGFFPEHRWPEVEEALLFACGFRPQS